MKFLNKEAHIKYLLDNTKETYERTNDKSELITPQHAKYACSISNEKGIYSFTYQCNPNYTRPTKEGLLACCLSDARCYEESITGKGEEENIQEFAYLFGYDNDIKGLLKAYKGCKEAYININKMFNKEEAEDLYEYFYEKGEI